MSRNEREPFLSESIRFLSFRLLCLSSDEEPIFVANTPIMVVVSRCARSYQSSLVFPRISFWRWHTQRSGCVRLFPSLLPDPRPVTLRCLLRYIPWRDQSWSPRDWQVGGPCQCECLGLSYRASGPSPRRSLR